MQRSTPANTEHDGPRTTGLRQLGSSFVGRRDDLEALGNLFDTARLVTLIGPGGIGKTRLAFRYAEESSARHAPQRGGDICAVELGTSRTESEFLTVAAAAFGVELSGLALEDVIAKAIGHAIARRGRILVVLDDFEQVAASAPILEQWIDAAPSARFLVTSRVVLGLSEEVTQVVAPLPPNEAMELFLARARNVHPLDDEPTAQRLATEIVEAIDRMPLAIELAASRTRVLSLVELRDRLDRPLAVLGGGRDRHASVRRAVLDSVHLLPEPLQRLFALIATLRDGFTLDAVEGMLELSHPEAMHPGAVLDCLDTLVRSSLLRVIVEQDGPTRYAYFKTIRDVAEELLEKDPDREVVRAAHARAYATAAPQLGARVAKELDNLLLSHATSVALAQKNGDRSRARDSAVVARTLEPLLSARGLSRLRASLSTDVLTALDVTRETNPETRAEAHLSRGRARRELGETTCAYEDFQAALDLAKGSELSGLAAVAVMRLGELLDLKGETVKARARFVEALAVLASADRDDVRTRHEAETRLRLGHAHRREGSLSAARGELELAARDYRKLGDDEGLAAALYELAVIEMFAGRTADAFAGFDAGLEVARRSGARLMEAAHTTARGCLLQDLGDLEAALEHHARAARIFHEHGSRWREASALYYLGTTYLERGEHREALAVFEQSRARCADVGSPHYDALIAGGIALAQAASGEFERAFEELARAETARRAVPDEPSLAVTLEAHRLTLEVYAGRREIDDAVREIEPAVDAAPSDDTRFALRTLRGVGRLRAFASAELVVWGEGEAFEPPSGERVPLPAGSPLRRVLSQLVTARLEAPGEAVSIDEVIRAGWPGERMRADAGLNRAYVALAALRKRGLRDLLVSTAGGYALSQAVVVRREPGGAHAKKAERRQREGIRR